MISSDDHPPPDQQKSYECKIDGDDKAHASVYDSDIDLIKSLVADFDDNPLPRFSIRDYVFNSRSKDIVYNWPFSHKTLHICLQHGVKNLLPPFQSLESLRDNSSVVNQPSDEEIVISAKRKTIVDQSVLVTSNCAKSYPGLRLESVKTSSSGLKRDKESQTHLQEDLAHTNLKKTALVFSQNIGITAIQTSIKRCRLGAKVNTVDEPVEEVAPNSIIVSETMASKVCPVCKTFSSSSNTTLNAHIDRCLSGESSMKWTANMKVIVKHKIKPRKTRLLVDIYKTAPHCTVEELDARNGTSWANKSTFPAQELEQGEEEKEENRATTVVPEVADHEGAVYIDTNGTKVRILSVPEVGTSDDHGARKLQKKGKLGKFITEKKKEKNHKHRHQQKYLQPSLNNEKLCSPKPNRRASYEVKTGQEENTGNEPVNPEVHRKLDDLPIVRPPWACSKRTGFAKKLCGDFRLAHNATKNLSLASDKSFSELSKTPPSSSNKMGTSSPYKGQPNRATEFSPMGHYAKKRYPLTKPSSKHLKKEGMLFHGSCEDPSDGCPSKLFKGSNIKSNGSKFLSPGKKLPSVSKEPTSKLNRKRKFSALKRSCTHPFSKQNFVSPFQNSLKQKSWVEEVTSGKPSSESMINMDFLEVRKNDETKICKQKKSSRSSNGDSSAWLETDRKETRSHEEQLSTVQVDTGIAVGRSSLGLSNSLNPDKLFDTRKRDDDKEMYCADFIEKTKRIEDVTDDIERQQNYFHEGDPIPLPEQPESFLPSPGRDKVSGELHGNSCSANTSRIQSSEHQPHHDTMDRDSMSDSSTISNPRLARSDSNKVSVRSPSLKDDTRGFSGAMVDAINENPITSTTTGDWITPRLYFTEKGPTPGFKNDQPCCCSRKEGASSQNHQELTLLRKKSVESLNFRPQMFSISNYPTSPAPPIAASPPTMKIPAYSECDSVGSPSKPAIRLMGKNLTVVEDVSLSLQFKPPPHISSMARFPDVKNEQNFPSLGYHPQHPVIFSHNQNGFKSQHPNNMRRPSHAIDTTFGGTPYMDSYGHGSPMIPRASLNRNRSYGQMLSERDMNNAPSKSIREIIIIDDSHEDKGNIDDMRTRRNGESFSSSILDHNHSPSGYPSQSSLSFSNGSFQTCSPFREVEDNDNLAKWNCAPAGSSRSLSPSIYYPRSFS